MDGKGDAEKMTYPHIMFCIDNFQEIFHDLFLSAPDQKIAVQLVAMDKRCSLNQLVFLGALDHSILLKSCLKKEKGTLSSRIRRLSDTSKSRHVYSINQSYHLINMRGPNRKGFAEMAIERRVSSPYDTCAVAMVQPDSHVTLTPPTGEAVEVRQKHSPKPGDVLDLDLESDSSDISSKTKDCNPVLSSDGDVSTPLTQEYSHMTSLHGVVSDHDHTSASACSHDDDGENLKESPKQKQKLKFKTFTSRSRVSPSSNSGMGEKGCSHDAEIYTYLTYVQLPWYSLLEDILNNTIKPIF